MNEREPKALAAKSYSLVNLQILFIDKFSHLCLFYPDSKDFAAVYPLKGPDGTSGLRLWIDQKQLFIKCDETFQGGHTYDFANGDEGNIRLYVKKDQSEAGIIVGTGDIRDLTHSTLGVYYHPIPDSTKKFYIKVGDEDFKLVISPAAGNAVGINNGAACLEP